MFIWVHTWKIISRGTYIQPSDVNIWTISTCCTALYVWMFLLWKFGNNKNAGWVESTARDICNHCLKLERWSVSLVGLPLLAAIQVVYSQFWQIIFFERKTQNGEHSKLHLGREVSWCYTLNVRLLSVVILQHFYLSKYPLLWKNDVTQTGKSCWNGHISVEEY